MSPLVPRSVADRVAWACLAGGTGFAVVALAQFWGANPGYADRFLILLGSLWAAVKCAPHWAAVPIRPRPLLGVPLVLLAGAGFAAGVFLEVQIGPRTLVLWWLTFALIVAAAALALARVGWPRLRVAAFPLIFPFFALPIPTRILVPLQDVLQEVTTSVAQVALSSLGVEVSREQFVLALPGGKLRVEEACSGVRSVTALTALAAFVAFLRGFGPVRGTLLVVLSVPVIAAVNALRVVLSGLIQEAFGPKYIQHDWHEALGFGMVLVGLAAMLGLARLLGPKVDTPAGTPVEPPRRPNGWIAAGVLLALTALTVFAAFAGWHEEERAANVAPLSDITPQLGAWTGIDEPVPPVVTDLLDPDVALHRTYEDNVGHRAGVWVFYWHAGSAIKGYHHPDVCWGNSGFQPTKRWTEAVVTAEGGKIGVTARDFCQGRESQIVLYWTQEGRRVWTDADENAAMNDMLTSSWSGHRWVGDLLGAPRTETGPRLVVVVNAPSAGAGEQKAIVRFTHLLAAELYRVCPWAAPGAGAE